LTAPPFALPAPDPRDPPAGAPPVANGRERARRLAVIGALGAAAAAAALMLGAAIVVFELDMIDVLARPATIADDITAEGLRELAGLPGPSVEVVAALVPAVALLLLAGALGRLGEGAAPVHRISPEALGAAERTMAWAVRVIAAGTVLVFVVPALLQLAGFQAVTLTTGSMAPAHPAGSLLFVSRPADPAAVPVGTVIVIGLPDGSHVTHRVAALVRGDGDRVTGYRTRGDAAAGVDPAPVSPEAIAGLVAGGVPIIGALRAWMASPLGIAVGLVLAWAFGGLAVLLGDDRRRAVAAQATTGARGPAAGQATRQPAARSTSRPTS